jgi:hypothetical protein
LAAARFELDNDSFDFVGGGHFKPFHAALAA